MIEHHGFMKLKFSERAAMVKKLLAVHGFGETCGPRSVYEAAWEVVQSRGGVDRSRAVREFKRLAWKHRPPWPGYRAEQIRKRQKKVRARRITLR